ncbi:diadenosine tetraphosphate (Ap4A) hydrolase [gamma proteobacterium HdN1]|nr:diadenosine tetraphosphate (Ap4A) hydrolase [gamma proteobacterium HdN1]
MSCIFCAIVAGHQPCHKIWEDEAHLAFLSIYPNIEGFSVVIPKRHLSSYVFDHDDQSIAALLLASKKVATVLDRYFSDVGRTGLIFEGYGVDHLHSKLFPMHGTGGGSEFRPISSSVDKYFTRYEGYISSHDYKRADDAVLAELASRIRASC